MQRYKQLPIIGYGKEESMIKKDKKHVSKSTLLKSKIQASANGRLGDKMNWCFYYSDISFIITTILTIKQN